MSISDCARMGGDVAPTPKMSVQHSEKGQALVEMALILPILVMLAMLTLDVGRVFTGYIALVNSAREGAIYASLNPYDPNLSGHVRTAVINELDGTVAGAPTVSITGSTTPGGR